ncbi:hypothetical protein BDL97_01G053900 [Sphagnum fallax]|nr:hypothetical protein BDL97_01G053900 [Sphagnum fallax]
MAADGEERVLVTAQQIVRSLGTTDTAMTDDMFQILSKFDHRFSNMNGKSKKLEWSTSQEVDATATDEDLQQSKSSRPSSRGVGSSKMIESRLDHAEDVVVRWHMGYSERAKQQRIFECPEEEASTYLEAVDEVQNLLEQLSVQNKEEEQQPATLERAHNVIQLAMERLEEEFRHLLAQNSRSVDPDWLFDSMAVAGSFRSSFDDDHHHTVDAASEISSSGEEDAAGDEDEDVLPVARPREIVPTTVDLVHPEVVMDLSSIAQRMIAANHQLECCQVYVNSRKAVLEDSLYGLGVEKLSIEEVQKMPWDILVDTIRKWIQAMKVGALVLFASEKLLCEQVFPAPISETCFSDVANETMMQLLSLSKALATGQRSPEKLFKVLDMYESLWDLLPKIENIFSGVSGASLKSEASGILLLLEEAATGTFAEFESAIQRDGSRTPVPGGGVHPLSRYVMNYIKLLCEYKGTLEQLFREKNKDGMSLSGTDDGELDVLGGDDGDRIERKSWLAVQIHRLIHVLHNNLDGKSKVYRDPALTYLFLMNNIHYIVQKVKYSDVIGLLGNDWVRRRSVIVRQFATSYQRAAWTRALSFLKDEGIHSSGSFSSGVSKMVLKDRFKNFNAAFEEAHKAQTTWVVSDPQLRDELRISISEMLLPAYRAFFGRYGNFLETEKRADKYIKFSPEDLEIAIDDFFEGSSGSLAVRRRPFTTQ